MPGSDNVSSSKLHKERYGRTYFERAGQTIDELLAIQREHYPVAEQEQQPESDLLRNARQLVKDIEAKQQAEPQATAEQSSAVKAVATAPATEYSWSSNGEEYHGRFSSVAEAVCDYLDSEDGDAEEAVHVGEVKPYEPGNPIWLADNVLETLSDNAYGEIGEWVEGWPELPPEKREQLGKMIQNFVWTHDAPRFFSIGKSELVEVAPYRDDAAEQKGGA